jgi:hypothetical protein
VVPTERETSGVLFIDSRPVGRDEGILLLVAIASMEIDRMAKKQKGRRR